ncbi:MAG: DUF998 domain-containing protein [Candidatus Zixiibacteriota bacterium]
MHQQDKGLKRLSANPQNTAGILLALAGSVAFIGMMISEALYEGYSLSSNFISDLGARCVWDFPKPFPDIETECFIPPTPAAAFFFNSVIFISGLLVVMGTYSLHTAIKNGKTSGLRLQPAYKGKILIRFMALSGIGVVGTGLFPESAGVIHIIFAAVIGFTFGNLAAITSASLVGRPLNFFSATLGVIGLAAAVLGFSGNHLGIGIGGMERMILYPILLWAIVFGGYLITPQADSKKAK